MNRPRVPAAGLLFTLVLAAAPVFASGVAVPEQKAPTAKAPSAAQRQFNQAQRVLLQGHRESALAAVREGLASEPRSVEGLNLLGIIYDQQKQYAQAESAFKEALRIDPRSTKTHNNLGNNYVLEKKLDLAEHEFRATLRLNPRDHDAGYNLGLVLLARGDARGAITYLSRVTPRDASTSFNLVQAYLRTGEISKALELARWLSGRSPKDPRLHFSLGIVLAAQKQYEPAIREFELADALRPGTFEILYNLGQAYRREQDYARAEDALTRALALQPGSASALYVLAETKSDERKYVDALDLLLRARKLDPKNTDVLFLMGRISMIQNYFEDAIPVLEDGVKIDPRRADLHAALGESYFTVGKVDRAIEEFKTLIALDPSASSYAFMGLAYRHLGRFEEAKHYFNLGIAQDSRNSTCLYNLGYIANKQGNYAEADKFLNEALKSQPDYADALYELAAVKMTEKKYAEAIPLLEKCSKSMPRPAEAYYKLATAERNLRRMEAAARDMRVFETLAKDQPGGPMPFQHLFDALNQRLNLPREARAQLDLEDLKQQVARHPDQPRNLYLLAEAYLKLGDVENARKMVAQIDQASGGDYRTALGVGTLLAQYHLFPEAIQHFQMALAADPSSDDAKYDLADAYFQTRDYVKALDTVRQVSPQAQNDDSYLALSGDIFAHAGRAADAVHTFEEAVRKNPDNDQYVLSLALVETQTDATAAEKTLRQGLTHTPDSGRLYWGLGVVSVIEGRNAEAERYLKRAVELLPDWPTSYSALGTFYYETGQISKARETLSRYQQLFPHGALDVSRIQQTLAHASDAASVPPSLPAEARLQFLGIASALADQTP